MFKYVFLILLAVNATNATAQVNLNSGLIAYYPFSGNFQDASGNGNNGTGIGGVTFVPDQWGNPNSAVNLDGTSGWVSVPASPGITPTTYATICFRFNSNSTNPQNIISKSDYYNDVNNIQFQIGFDQPVQNTMDLFFNTLHTNNCTTSGFFGSNYVFAGTISSNTWYCVVAIFDSGTKRVYVNGILAGTGTVTATPNNNAIDYCPDGLLNIGAWWSGDPQRYGGVIDEVRLYNRVLNTQEIDSLCNYNPVIAGTCDTISMQDTIRACKNTTISLGATVTGSASVLSTIWSPGTGLSNPAILNPQCTVGGTSVNYTLTVKALMANGDTCITSKSVYVAVSNLNPQIRATHVHCTKQFNFTAIDSVSSNGSFIWSFGDATTASGISVSHIYSSYATYNVTLSETDGYGCKDSVTEPVAVTPNLNLILNVTHDTTICVKGDFQLTVSGADSAYQWSPPTGLNDPFISDPIANIDSTIKYVVTGVDSGGICKGTDSVTIHLAVPPDVTVTGNSSICYGQYDQLNASGAVSYSWSPPDYITNSDIANPLVHPIVPTTYVVTGTGSNGCIGKDSISIDVRPLPVLSVSVSGTVTCKDTAVQLSVSGANTYIWSPAGDVVNDDVHSQDPYVSPAGNTEFYVTGTDATGCSNIDSVLVVSDKSASLFMPNAFTPNNDGLNDVIYPNVFCDLILDQFSIYNRWGQRVFTTSTEGAGWDGKFNGVLQPLGTFDYYVKGHKRSTGKSVFYKGNFTLVR